MRFVPQRILHGLDHRKNPGFAQEFFGGFTEVPDT